MDPFTERVQFDGGIISSEVGDGSRKAQLTLESSGIFVRTDNGETLALGWHGLKLERGGAGGDVVFVHSRHPKATLFSEDPEFVRGLESFGGNEVVDELARLGGQRVGYQRSSLIGCLIMLGILALVLWTVPRMYRAAVDGAVDALPYSVDEALGEAVVGSLELGGEEVTNETVRAAMQTILDRLVPHTSMPEAEFQFRVVESEDINAFALPGGYLTIFTGLIAEAETPEEVAAVLAHEIAHVTERHGLRRLANSIGTFVGLRLIVGDTDGLLGLATELFTMARVNDYSQDQETAADAEGVRLLSAAGLDPLALADFFALLEDRHGDVPGGLAWLSSHPPNAQRIKQVRELAQTFRGDPQPLTIDWAAVRAALAE